MKVNLKSILSVVAAIFVVITIAAGAAVLIYRFLGDKKEEKNYIECECDPDYT